MTDGEMAKEWVKNNCYPYSNCPNILHKLEEAFLAGLKAGKEKAKKEIEEEFLKCYQGYSENISEE